MVKNMSGCKEMCREDKNVCEEIVVLAKFHLRGKRLKTEISALSGSTRLCLGCFNPCVCHRDKSLPLGLNPLKKTVV